MDRPNILLIIMDTVRARNTSIHGYERDTTPYLEEFASESDYYLQARAPGGWSLPSHASIFTGLDIAEHGIHARGDQLQQGNSIWEEINKEGYETAVFSSNTFLGKIDTGLQAGFDNIFGVPDQPIPGSEVDARKYNGEKVTFLKECLKSKTPVKSLLNGAIVKIGWEYPKLLPNSITNRTTSGPDKDDLYISQFLDWHDDQNGPWGACINLMDAHAPYKPDDKFDKWASDKAHDLHDSIDGMLPAPFWQGERPSEDGDLLMDLYDGCIRQVDNHIQTIVEELRERGDLDDTLVVITSDHGEAFAETSPVRPDIPLVGHTLGLTESLTHVPLLVRYPETNQTSQTRTDLARIAEFPNIVRGILDGKTPDFTVEECFVSAHEFPHTDKIPEDEQWKVKGRSAALYRNREDKLVRKDLIWREETFAALVSISGKKSEKVSPEPEIVESALAKRSDVNIQSTREDDLNVETVAQLEDLGYM